MDFKFGDGQLESLSYQMFPVISGWLDADKEMQSYISQMRQTKYTDTIMQSRRKDAYFYPAGSVRPLMRFSPRSSPKQTAYSTVVGISWAPGIR